MHILVHVSLYTCLFPHDKFLRIELVGRKECTFKILTNTVRLLNSL